MKKAFLRLIFIFGIIGNAQEKPKEVLFTIDQKPYYTDEFIRVYNKNLDLVKDESQKDLNQYLDLFIGYKLKVNKANKIGLQDKPQYQNELKGYRTQLAKNYLNDSKVTAALVNEGYERLKKEIKASHILISVDENASPADTLVAYKKALDIRQRALNGEDFGKLASEFSQDPSAKENQGDLGYFTAFRMVYPFETAAYNTPKDKISNPVRTRFGYHLIKVTNIRDNRGDVQVAHIMTLKSKEKKEDNEKAKTTIEEIYKKVQQGENFEELAKQFSEDKSSAPKGGVLNRFGSGQLSAPEFEDVAFSLTKDNPISTPFETQFGWHIVKFIEKYPLKTLEESKTELENKISRDERSRLISSSLTEKLRKKYKVKKNDKLFASTSKAVTPSFYEAKWETPTDTKPYEGTLFSIEEKNISGVEYLNFVKTQQKANAQTKPLSKLVDVLYTKMVDEQLNKYYDEHLETEFPEFGAIVEEYRDGLLLFDLMEKEIWERSKTDTLGLQSFYESQKDKHRWKTRLDIIVTSSTQKEMVKKAKAMLEKGMSPDAVKEKLNTKEVVNIMINQNILEEGNEGIPQGTKPVVGVSDIVQKGDYYYVSKVVKVLPEGFKTFEECKGKVINDYQQYLEQNWVNELKKEFTVKINQGVFEKVKSQIKK